MPVNALVDTSVLVSDQLWLALVTFQELGTDAAGLGSVPRLRLFYTEAIAAELLVATRRVYRLRSREQQAAGVQARLETLTLLEVADSGAKRRPFVKDPDDAHLDVAAWKGAIDVLISNDVRAFKPVAAGVHEHAARGYVLMNADAFIAHTWDQAPAYYRERFVSAWRELYVTYCKRVGVAVDERPASAQLRRARAFTLAKRLR